MHIANGSRFMRLCLSLTMQFRRSTSPGLGMKTQLDFAGTGFEDLKCNLANPKLSLGTQYISSTDTGIWD